MPPNYETAFVPLNLTEIAILGGRSFRCNYLGDVITFNTTTCAFKTEIEDHQQSNAFRNFRGNQSIKVCENTVIALIEQYGSAKRLMKYTKGDTSVTTLMTFKL